MAHKLDLTRLSDEEARHVWDVIQRDFNLRKSEEQRLGELKTKIEKEDTKTELLGSQASLSASHCIRCLQPFKFLVNSKRQCLDCHMSTCKACSRYNKKEHGWVCDNCRMTRVVKNSTAGWFHDNMHNRFKRFGSAKVMRSLYKRLNGGDSSRDDDTQSMPDVHASYNGFEEDQEADVQRFKSMRKNKRLLSVHPLDFEPEEYYPPSRRQSIQYQQLQEERAMYRNEMEYQNDMYSQRVNRRRSVDRYAMRPDEYGDNRMVRARSMTKISPSMSRQQYVDTSDEEDAQRFPPMHQQPFRRRPSRASSQENIPPAPPINELSKRMWAIESLLNRLEEKITASDEEDDKARTPAAQREEEKLRRKLSELAGHLSDKGPSSDEEPGKRARGPHAKAAASLPFLKDPEMSSSSGDEKTDAQRRSSAAALCDLTTEVLRTINATENAMMEYGFSEPTHRTSHLVGTDAKRADAAYRTLEENVYMAAGKSFELENKLRRLEGNAKNTTDSELSELEDVLTQTAARVQSTESEVSDLESKIAALSVAGMDKSKKKVSGSQQRKRFNQDLKSSNGRDRMGNR